MATVSKTRNENSELQRSQQVRGNHSDAMQPFDDLYNYFQEYTRERPEVVAMWCFGIGFVLGWKLKPW